MEDEVELCNKSLMQIGASRIIRLAEDSKEARHCRDLYPSVRDAVMRAHPWNCCIERAELAQLSDAPAWEYAHQYTLPTDPYCLRVLQMEHLDYKFRVEGRKLLTNEGTAKIIYIARRTVVNEFDALLCEAIATRLSSSLAYPIVDSSSLVKVMWDLYNDRVLPEARGIDAQEGTPETIEATTWIDSRR